MKTKRIIAGVAAGLGISALGIIPMLVSNRYEAGVLGPVLAISTGVGLDLRGIKDPLGRAMWITGGIILANKLVYIWKLHEEFPKGVAVSFPVSIAKLIPTKEVRLLERKR